jgi:5-formyltetrahydrofolate cyclo-ligase
MRTRRRSLDPRARRRCAEGLVRVIARTPLFQRCRRIAFYIANDGELDPARLMARAWGLGKTCYLPAITPLKPRHLGFVDYRPGDPLVPNRYGIPEPDHPLRSAVLPWALDLILVPLVSFDMNGSRLGMGAGYYDRTLAFLNQRQHWHRPLLMGVGYEFQRVDYLPAEPWDIPLQAIATETTVYTVDSRQPAPSK